METNFYKVINVYYINGVRLYDRITLELIKGEPTEKEVVYNLADVPDLLAHGFNFDVNKDRRGMYFRNDNWACCRLPASLCEPVDKWSLFFNGMYAYKLYLDTIKEVKVTKEYFPAQAPAVKELSNYPTELVIDFLKERGMNLYKGE